LKNLSLRVRRKSQSPRKRQKRQLLWKKKTLKTRGITKHGTRRSFGHELSTCYASIKPIWYAGRTWPWWYVFIAPITTRKPWFWRVRYGTRIWIWGAWSLKWPSWRQLGKYGYVWRFWFTSPTWLC
jgi:hypothetical protein